jgi:malate dehydrogenase (oxaloacetate-decarboxylating)
MALCDPSFHGIGVTEIFLQVAIALAEKAFDEGVAGVEWDKELVRKKVVESRWEPAYGKYVYDPEGES